MPSTAAAGDGVSRSIVSKGSAAPLRSRLLGLSGIVFGLLHGLVLRGNDRRTVRAGKRSKGGPRRAISPEPRQVTDAFAPSQAREPWAVHDMSGVGHMPLAAGGGSRA